MWEPLLNPIWVTEALNRPQKGLDIELNGKFETKSVKQKMCNKKCETKSVNRKG